MTFRSIYINIIFITPYTYRHTILLISYNIYNIIYITFQKKLTILFDRHFLLVMLIKMIKVKNHSLFYHRPDFIDKRIKTITLKLQQKQKTVFYFSKKILKKFPTKPFSVKKFKKKKNNNHKRKKKKKSRYQKWYWLHNPPLP